MEKFKVGEAIFGSHASVGTWMQREAKKSGREKIIETTSCKQMMTG
jgi:hypothetical protein